MQYILTPDQMRQADRTMMEHYGIPSLVLMENAARSAADVLLHVFRERKMVFPSVFIFCGSGNNGGDGFALARHIYEQCDVTVFRTGDPARMTEETALNAAIVQKLGIPVYHLATEQDVEELDISCECVVDALLGVGGSEHPRGVVLAILQKLQYVEAMNVALDVPTGVNAATGARHEYCFAADYTITMGYPKTGMYLRDADDYCGTVIPVSFGIPEHVVAALDAVRVFTDDDIRLVLPFRQKKASKHKYGTTLVVGGTRQMPGAPALAAHGALAIGAGRVRLCTPLAHHAVWPEIMLHELSATETGSIDEGSLSPILTLAEKAQAVVFGPGLGTEPATLAMGYKLIESLAATTPIVVDADGLLCLQRGGQYGARVVATPHEGEFARLTGLDIDTVRLHAHELVVEWAEKLGCTLLLKGVPTFISDGARTVWNVVGNPALATAGSGDVLAGLIGGLMAQGVEPFAAASLGAYLHGRAADVYTMYHAEETMRASDVFQCIGNVLAGVSCGEG